MKQFPDNKTDQNNNNQNSEIQVPEVPKVDNKVRVEGIDTRFITQFQTFTPYRRYSRVSDQLLRYLYLRTSRLRECIDGIAGEVSSRLPVLVPIPKKLPQEIYIALEKFAEKFFGKLNRKKDTIQTLISKVVRDLLVHDRFFIEKVRNKKGELVELYVRDPMYMIIDKNDSGIIERFRQVIQDKEVEFSPDDIIYGVLHPCSYDDYGLPIIEGILDEVASLILSTRTIANYIFDDSIPPGILVLGEIGEAAFQRLKEEFKNPELRNRIKVIRNIDPKNVDWIRLDRSISSENKLDFLLERIDTIILKAFQIPTEREISSRGGSEMAYKISQSKLIEPIIKLIEKLFTEEIFWKEFNLPVEFRLLKRTDVSGDEFYDKSRSLSLLVNSGILTANEARMILGSKPIAGGDIRIGKLGNEYIYYDDTGMPRRIPDFLS